MAKDPAFLFYYQDFMYGTRRFTREQRGLYIELICEQADSATGSISEQDFNEITDCSYAGPVKAKFKKDQNGYYNQSLRDKIVKRKAFTESRRKNLDSKKDNSENNVSMETHMGTHKADHMENENKNKNEIVIINKAREFYNKEYSTLKDADPRIRNGYYKFIGTLFNSEKYPNDFNRPLIEFLQMPIQLTYGSYDNIRTAAKKKQVNIYTLMNRMINDPKYTKGKESIYLLFMDWLGREPIKGTNL